MNMDSVALSGAKATNKLSPDLWSVGLACDTVCRPAEGVSNPPPASFEDVIFHRLRFRSLPQFFIADLVWPVDLEDPSEAAFDDYCY